MWKRLWEFQKRLARRIGTFQARVILSIFYAVVVLPFGVAVRLLSDPLRVKWRPTQWLDHPDTPADMTWARRQF